MKLRNKKTGGLASILADEQDFIRVYTDAGWHDYDSISEMMEDWEDYKQYEPLIKDEKSRKIVRAWLEANDLDGATFHTSSHFFHYWNLRGFNDNGQGIDIDFFLTWEGIPNLIDGKYYTKFELCGEEEE